MKTTTWRIVTRLNEKRVHAWLVCDLFTLDMLRCRPISQQRRTRPLAEVWQDVADEETQTTATMSFSDSSHIAHYSSKKP